MAITINGNGSISGISVGGLPDGTVDAGTLATNSVDSAELIDGAVDNSHLADDAVAVAELSATGTASSSTFLRGDNAWAAAGTTQVSFYAKPSGGAQSISAGTYTKITYANEIIDTHSAYDTTNSRFTPTIAGYYLFVARASVNNAAASDYYMGVFYKNGSQYDRGGNCKPDNDYNALTGSCIMYMNGSSDYVEHYVLTQSALTLEGNTDWFQGVLVS